MFRKLIASAMLLAIGVTGVGVATATSSSASLPDSGNFGYGMLLTPPVLTTDMNRPGFDGGSLVWFQAASLVVASAA